MDTQPQDTGDARQYLAFSLQGERFALPSSLVSEVLPVPAITRVPRVPAFLLGVVNLRGNAATVVDLRLKFGLDETPQTEDTCLIVVERSFDGEKLAVAVLADAVHEVFELADADILDPPDMGTVLDPAYLTGMARRDGRFTMLLNPERLLCLEELAARPVQGPA